MSGDLYIWITRWEDFQVYQKKRGKTWAPPWIRVYTRLLDDYNYLGLTGRQRGLLHDIWLLFAKTRLELGLSPARIGRMIGDETVRMRDLEALNRAGFIEFCSRTVLEQRRNTFWNGSTLEVEVEEDRDKSSEGKLRSPDRDNYTPNGLPISNEILYQRLLAYVGAHGDDNTPAVIRSYTNRATEGQLAKVLESAVQSHARNRAKYVVGALRDEVGSAERTAA